MKAYMIIGYYFIAAMCFASQEDKVQKTLFYEVIKNGHHSYVLGTYHYGISLDRLPSYVLDKLQGSDILVTEWVLNENKLKRIEEGTFSKNKQKVNSRGSELSSDDYHKLIEHWGMTKERALSVKSRNCDVLFDHTAFMNGFMDAELQILARDQNKRVVQLDTQYFVDLQLEQSSRQCDVSDLLQYSPQQIQYSYEAIMKKSIDAYVAGDVDHLSAGLEVNAALATRNIYWVNHVLDSVLSQGKAFIAFGASHLYGQQGVIELLKERGYEVRLYEDLKKCVVLSGDKKTCH